MLIVSDATSNRLKELGVKHYKQFQAEHRAPAIELIRAFVTAVAPRLEGRAAAEALEAHLGAIEERIAAIAARHSRYFWRHLAARVPPQPVHEVSAWTTVNYRRVFSLALLKHGGADDTDMTEGAEALTPTEISYEDMRDIYALEYLSFAFNRATTAYRRVGKGAALVTDGASDYSAEADEKLEQQMQLLDRRVARYHQLLSGHGTARVTSLRGGIGGEELSDDVLILPSLNVEQRELPAHRAASLGVPEKPNYLPAAFPARPADDYFAIFAVELETLLGVPPSRLMAFLCALSRRQREILDAELRTAFQYFQRGYTVVTADGLDAVLDDLSKYYQLMLRRRSIDIDSDTAADEVRRIVAALTYSPDEIKAISLWDTSPVKPILTERAWAVWDHSAIPLYLWTLAGLVSRHDGEVANRKSAAFEQEVNEAIRGAGRIQPWRTGELVREDGSKREVDASFVANGVLYVVECKAFSANPRVARGDFAALKGRWTELDGYLAQARTLAEFLRAHPVGRNYSLPTGVSRIEHCVCTPLAEYVPTNDSAYWFDDETPRICVPQELLEFVAGTKPRLRDIPE